MSGMNGDRMRWARLGLFVGGVAFAWAGFPRIHWTIAHWMKLVYFVDIPRGEAAQGWLFVALFAAATIAYALLPQRDEARSLDRFPRGVYLETATLALLGLLALAWGAVLDHTRVEVVNDVAVFQIAWYSALSLACYASLLAVLRSWVAHVRTGRLRRGLLVFAVAACVPRQWKRLLAVDAAIVGALCLLYPGNASGELAMIALLAAMACAAHISALDRAQLHAQRLARGDWSTSDAEDAHGLREIESALNGVGDAARAAAEESIRSERTKAELITNVSHDIKTPLTSIINYVDLLKRDAAQAGREGEYLDVLERKAQRLKTLIVDLVEASRASGGDVAVEWATLDLSELLAQVAGEFDERLSAAGLALVWSAPEPLFVRADGRHLWRVLENLFVNVVGYAQAGTRVYAQATRDGDRAAITIKNVSRAPLNIAPDELMERFVRGDASRHDGHSGLGLFIARSLMEVQGGALHLRISGDLFEAEMELPLAEDGDAVGEREAADVAGAEGRLGSPE